MLRIIKTIEEMRKEIEIYKKQKLSIGLVPTMGCLHEGHQSLIKKAVEENEKVIVSIFVNPIQFAPNEDLEKYPKDFENDKLIVENSGADIIFHPNVSEIYPEKLLSYVDIKEFDKELCGAKRIGHFRGVCTIVSKLFNIINPNKAYFGKKDAQQLIIIKKMVKDLNYNIEIIPCNTVREKDGLAKSSRNKYLNQEERKAALILSKTLLKIKKQIENGERNSKFLLEKAIKNLEAEKLAKIDYVDIVDLNNLKKVEVIKDSVLVAMAVFIGKTRLIDNYIYEIKKK